MNINKFAWFLWFNLLLILFTGWYGYYLFAGVAAILFVVFLYAVIRQYIKERKPTTEETDLNCLEFLANLGEDGRKEFENERQEYIKKWGRDPGTFESFYNPDLHDC